ncbi:hypothetical protein OAA09_01300 [bacterium]|nr:hypothetical protein [bacterium]
MYKGGQFMKGGGRAAKGGQMAGRGRFAKVTEAGAKGLQKLKSAGAAVGGKFPKITAGLVRMGGAIAQLGPLAQKAGGKLASLGSKTMSAGKAALSFGSKWGGKAMSGLKKAGSTIAKFSPALGKAGKLASGAAGLAGRAFGSVGTLIGTGVNSIYEGFKGFGAATAAGGNWADKLGGSLIGGLKGVAEGVDFATFGMLDKMTGFNGAFENMDFGYIGETFSYMGKEAWQGTKDFFGGIGDSISNGWTAIGGAKAVSKLKEMGGNLVNGIKDGWNSSTVGKGVNKMAKSAGSMISKAGGWLKKKFSIFSPSKYFATAIGGPLVGGIVDGFTDPKKRKALIGGAKTLFSKVGKFFSSGDAKKLLGKGLKMGKDLVMGIVSGSTHKKALKAAVNGMATVGKKIYGGFKSFFKISSPSKLMEEGGADIIGGLTNGVDMAVKAMDLITPEIAEKLGFGKDGNLTPEAKAAQEALKSSSDILNSVMDMITNLNEMGKIAADFDPVLIQGKMTIVFAKLEDAFLGPDGILEKQAALQKKIADKVKEIAMRGKTYRKYSREEFRAVRDGWADSNTHGVKFDRQSAIQQAQTAANKKSEATAMDAFNAQGDLMNTQMGGLGDLLGGMTGMIEEANKLDKLSKDFDFDKIDTAINTLSNGALGLATAVNTYFIDNKDAFDMSLSLKMIKDELIPGISTFNSMFKKDFLKDYSYDVYKKRIRWAKNLQGQIKSLTSEIAVINTMVNGIPDIELKATIDDVEDSMSIVKEFTKIKDKPINLNFNLQISMDANNLAQVILETETGSTIMRNK